jgi:hypothetical protein
MKYKWIRQMDGAVHVPAQVVGTELARLEEANGGALLPTTVVKSAKRKGSKLHPCFEWNDEAAAKRYRLKQASEMLRKIVVVYDDGKGEPQTIRAFVNIKSEKGEGYYCHTSRLLDDPELQENVLNQILAELVALRAKHSKYKSPRLQKIWDAIDEAVTE